MKNCKKERYRGKKENYKSYIRQDRRAAKWKVNDPLKLISSHPNYEILIIFQHAVHEKTEKNTYHILLRSLRIFYNAVFNDFLFFSIILRAYIYYTVSAEISKEMYASLQAFVSDNYKFLKLKKVLKSRI